MNRPLKRLLFAFLLTFCATSIFAQATRTYVSTHGSDTNTATNCSDILNPCRLLQTAHNNTNPGGQILALDSGFYGPLTITKAINVVVPDGTSAGIVAPANGVALTVNSGSTDIVHLSGLRIIGAGNPGTTGILLTGGLRTEVRNSEIQGCKYGVRATADTRVQLDHVLVYDFTDGANGGIGVWANTSTATPTTGASTMKFFVTDCKVTGGDTGVKVDGGGFMMTSAANGGDRNQITFTIVSANVSANAYSSCTQLPLITGFNGQAVGGANNNTFVGVCNAP